MKVRCALCACLAFISAASPPPAATAFKGNAVTDEHFDGFSLMQKGIAKTEEEKLAKKLGTLTLTTKTTFSFTTYSSTTGTTITTTGEARPTWIVTFDSTTINAQRAQMCADLALANPPINCIYNGVRLPIAIIHGSSTEITSIVDANGGQANPDTILEPFSVEHPMQNTTDQNNVEPKQQLQEEDSRLFVTTISQTVVTNTIITQTTVTTVTQTTGTQTTGTQTTFSTLTTSSMTTLTTVTPTTVSSSTYTSATLTTPTRTTHTESTLTTITTVTATTLSQTTFSFTTPTTVTLTTMSFTTYSLTTITTMTATTISTTTITTLTLTTVSTTTSSTTTTSTTNTTTTTGTSETTSTTTTTKVLVWSLDRIDDRKGLDGSFQDGGSGGGVHIYTFDSGVDWAHPDFALRAIPVLQVTYSTNGPLMEICNPDAVDIGDRTCAMDTNGHGTHVASVAAGKSYGVARHARIYVAKMMVDELPGDPPGIGYVSGLLMSIDYILGIVKKPAVFMLSSGTHTINNDYAFALETIWQMGITAVVAAGNDEDINNRNSCQWTPASVPSTITVGGSNQKDEKETISNYGSCIDIFAPGESITAAATDNITMTRDGTSAAVGHVAGLAASILTFCPEASPDFVKDAILTMSMSGIMGNNGPDSPDKLIYTRRIRYFFGIAQRDGEIDFFEWWERMPTESFLEAEALFNAVDADKNGKISVSEFQEVFGGII